MNPATAETLQKAKRAFRDSPEPETVRPEPADSGRALRGVGVISLGSPARQLRRGPVPRRAG